MRVCVREKGWLARGELCRTWRLGARHIVGFEEPSIVIWVEVIG